MRTTLFRTAVVAAMLLSGFASPALGRTWTDVSGKHTIDGEFVQAKGADFSSSPPRGWIRIKTPEEKLVPLKIDRLCPADQKYVKDLLQKKPELNGDGGAVSKEGPKPARPKSEWLKPESRPAKKKGQFRTSFKEHSPRGRPMEVFMRMDKERQKNIRNEFKDKPPPQHFYDVTKEQFEVFIPASYDGELPFGLFVFLSKDDNGAPPKEWLPILEKNKLIYIGPYKANNFERRQVSMGLDAVHYANKEYYIDPNRIYVGGFERGALGACGLALAYPDVFTGALVQSGGGYCMELRLPPNKTIKPKFQPIDLAAFGFAKKNGRYVFFGVQGDPGRLQSQLVAFTMKKDGFQHVSYSDMPVGSNPLEAASFEKGIRTLDALLAADIEQKYEKGAKSHDDDKNLGVALPALRMAACHATNQPFAKDAKERYLDLAARYEKDLAAVEERIQFGDTAKANKLLSEFRKRWNPACLADVQRLNMAIRQKRAPKRP